MSEKETRINLQFCEEKIIPLLQRIVKKTMRSNYQIERKAHGNFVTTIDISMENNLKESLHAILPEAGFIVEEEINEEKEFNWIIDPIDGTTNFIYGFPYTISVAFVQQKTNDVLLGIVYNPKDDLIYYAAKNEGSYIFHQSMKKAIKTATFPKDEGIAIIGMPYNRNKTKRIFQIAEKVYPYVSDLKRIGPSSLDICLVAEGKAKLYFELDLKPWDISAGQLILTEAGGQFLKIDDLYLFTNKDIVIKPSSN